MTTNAPETMRGMIRLKDVAKRIGVHKQTIYRWMRRGQFPKPVPISETTVAFFADEVVAWQNKKAAHDAPPTVVELKPLKPHGGRRAPRQ